MPEWCMKAAQALVNKWSIGEWSCFCDDPPDFDEAEVSQIAEVIFQEYQAAQHCVNADESHTNPGAG